MFEDILSCYKGKRVTAYTKREHLSHIFSLCQIQMFGAVIFNWILNFSPGVYFFSGVFRVGTWILSNPKIYPNHNDKDNFNSPLHAIGAAPSSILNTAEIRIVGKCTFPVNSLHLIPLIITHIYEDDFDHEFITQSCQQFNSRAQ